MPSPWTSEGIGALYDFTGRTAVPTGGKGVLGAEMARALAGCHADLVLIGRNVARAKQVMATFPESSPDRRLAIGADVLDRPALKEACRRVLDARGKVDFLINGAGGNEHPALTPRTGPIDGPGELVQVDQPPRRS